MLGGHFHVDGIGGGPIASRSRFAKFHQFFFHGCGDLLFIQAPTELAESFGAGKENVKSAPEHASVDWAWVAAMDREKRQTATIDLSMRFGR